MKTLQLLFSATLIVCSQSALAETYLIDGNATQTGSQITYHNITFTVGTTAFASFADFNAANPVSSSTVYVAPGTYSGATIDKYGLKIYGANAFRDWTARGSESTFTSPVYINAGAVEINGFQFTGAGQVIANTATNEAPLYSIHVQYNIFNNTTVSRSDGNALITIGSRYGDANANNKISQRRYGNCVIEHNRFNGGGSYLANSIGLFGIFGTTTVKDNYIYDGGNGVHICNAQDIINIYNNKFYYVGVTAANNADGGGVGAFSVYFERSAFDNSTALNITDNDFDHCYGKTSYMALLRVYPGSSGSTNCVTPVNLSVNINRNTFTNKTSVATNSGQLGENMLLYSDLGTTSAVKYSISDNHYDNRFYKFSYVTLADSWGQREIYSNIADQFTIAGKYSTMGTSIIDGKDISYHLNGTPTADSTELIQSMDIDPVTGDLYFLQLMGSTNRSNFNSANGLSSTDCEPLFLFRVPCTKKASKTDGSYTYSTSIQKMSLAKTGHGVKLSVFRDTSGQLWMVTGAKGSDNGTGDDLSGKAICRFKFVSGASVIADGRENSTVSLSYHNHPKGYNNAYADIDPVNRYICYSSSGGGSRKYCVYDLDAFLAGQDKEIKEYVMPKGATPVTGSGLSGDTGFEWKSYQSFCINGDYLYMYEGVGSSSNSPTHIVNIVNWRTNKFIQRKSFSYARINELSWGEPEALCIRPDVFGNVSMYLGVAANKTKAYVFKFHIDRHLNSSGNVIGDDTNSDAKHFNSSQYSGISMSPSASSLSFSAASTAETPTQTLTLSRTSEYMFGKWTAVITGEDGDVFTADVADHNQFSSSIGVNVTFHPDGRKNNYSANLRLSSPYASDVIIPLTATYTFVDPSIPLITCSDNSFSLSASPGSQASVTTHISGSFLQGYIVMNITGNNADLFSLSQNQITTDNPEADVTITYSPTAEGNHSAVLELHSTNAVAKYIPISGTCARPAISDNITSLTEGWNFSEAKGNLAAADWLSVTAPQSRDMAFLDNKLYIVNSNAAYNGSESVEIINAFNAEKIGKLNLDGVTGGQCYAASIKAFDGNIIMSNGAPDATTLKVYKWTDDNSAPTVILEDDTHGNVQCGEIMSVYGNWDNGKIMFSNGSKLVIYNVTNSVVSQTPEIISLKSSTGADYSVGSQKGSVDITLNDDGSYWVIGKDKAPTRFDSTGKFIEQVSSSVVNQSANAGRFFTFGNRKYMAAATYLLCSSGATTLNDGALILKDITDGISSSSTPLSYPASGLGFTRNVQFQQAVCCEVQERGVNIWILSCLQGIAYYYYGEIVTAVDAIEDDIANLIFNGTSVALSGTEASSIRIYNLAGSLVASTATSSIDVTNLAPGIYIASAIDIRSKVITKKIAIK